MLGRAFRSPVRRWIGIALLLAVASFTAPAQADSYSWSGASGRVEVSVLLSGFNEGAGAGGWDIDSARSFASWATRVDAILPAGASVSMHRDLTRETTLTIHRTGRVELVTMPEGPDFEQALSIVATRFGASVPPPPRPTVLYTIQLIALHSKSRAERFAAEVDARGVRADDSFYQEACHPCSIPEAHILGPNTDGTYRVVTGIFERPEIARRSLQQLRRRFGLSAFIRVL